MSRSRRTASVLAVLVVLGVIASEAQTLRTDLTKTIVPLNEIFSGGPPADGIPAIDRPAFVTPGMAKAWLRAKEPVLALEVSSDARAYPLQILMWHEIVNDTVDRDSRRSVTAARELVGLRESLERASTSVIELTCRTRMPEPWKIYPNDYGVFSRRTGSQFYYHVHDGAPHEAGHFHTVRFFPGRTAHIVAISMAANGWPQALFTVNLWAIGDAYESVENLTRYARHFQIEESRGDPRVIRFVNLVFRLFLPEIEQLQEEKAAALAAYRIAHPGVSPFEDRALEVTSRVEIDVRERVLRA